MRKKAKVSSKKKMKQFRLNQAACKNGNNIWNLELLDVVDI